MLIKLISLFLFKIKIYSTGDINIVFPESLPIPQSCENLENAVNFDEKSILSNEIIQVKFESKFLFFEREILYVKFNSNYYIVKTYFNDLKGANNFINNLAKIRAIFPGGGFDKTPTFSFCLNEAHTNKIYIFMQIQEEGCVLSARISDVELSKRMRIFESMSHFVSILNSHNLTINHMNDNSIVYSNCNGDIKQVYLIDFEFISVLGEKISPLSRDQFANPKYFPHCSSFANDAFILFKSILLLEKKFSKYKPSIQKSSNFQNICDYIEEKLETKEVLSEIENKNFFKTILDKISVCMSGRDKGPKKIRVYESQLEKFVSKVCGNYKEGLLASEIELILNLERKNSIERI